MTFNDSVTKAIRDIESLNKDVDNIKNYKLIGNSTLFLTISATLTFIFNNYFNIIQSVVFSFLFGSLFFILISIIFNKRLFKEFYLKSDSNFFPFYHKNQKKEIHEKYNNLDQDTKLSLNKTLEIYREIEIHIFLDNFLLYYIEKNDILIEYKSILEFISETEYDIDKDFYFYHTLNKLIKEDSFFYKKYKDELVDYIYNSNLKNKKLILSLIKDHIEKNSDIDSLYEEISNINIKKEQYNTIVNSL